MESPNQTLLAPQLTETIITDRNSTEHHQNRVNQEELSQLREHQLKNFHYAYQILAVMGVTFGSWVNLLKKGNL